MGYLVPQELSLSGKGDTEGFIFLNLYLRILVARKYITSAF